MESFLEEPAVTYIALVLATALLLVEVALPTLGVAGGLALLLFALAVYGITRQDLVWWPLLLAAAGVAIWTVLLVTRRPSVPAQVSAAAFFTAGSLVFCVLADDVPAVIAGITGSIVLPAVFPFLQKQARELMERPSDVGTESLVGRTAEVTRWSGSKGMVMLDGAYWNAVADDHLEPGDRVEVDAFAGMSLHVRGAEPEEDRSGSPAPSAREEGTNT